MAKIEYIIALQPITNRIFIRFVIGKGKYGIYINAELIIA